MANNYNDILTLVNAGNQMGLSNTIKRDYGIPLDFTSIQESYDAAIAYAATSTLAYVGQTVAVGAKLYIISDVANGTYTVGEGENAVTYDNFLAEVGSKTEGDGNTIELDGQTLKLAGLTGLDNSKTYVPSLVNGKLVWAEPSATTVEGLDTRLQVVEGKATALEATVNGTEEAEGLVAKVAANTEAISEEADARANADEDILAKIGDLGDNTTVAAMIAAAEQAAKDYADANDADTIYDDTALANRVTAIEETINGTGEGETRVDGLVDKVADNTAAISAETTRATEAEAEVLAAAKAYADAEIDGLSVAIEQKESVDYIVLKDKEGVEIASVNASKFVQDSFLDDVAYDSATGKITFTWSMGDGSTKTDEIDVSDLVDTYTAGNGLTLTDNEFAVDTTKIATVEALNAVSAVAEAATTVDEVNAQIDAKMTAANLGQYAKASDVETALAGKVDNSTYNTDKATFAIKSEVETALGTKVSAETYAEDKAALQSAIDGKVDKIENWTLLSPENQEKLAALVIGEEGDIEVSGTVNAENVAGLGSWITTNRDSIAGLFATADETKLDGIEAGAEVNTIETVKVNGTSLTPDSDRAVNVTVPTKFTDITDDSGFDARITAAKDTADAAASAVTTLESGQVATNKTDIAALNTQLSATNDNVAGVITRVTTLENSKSDHETRITNVEGKVTTLENNVTEIVDTTIPGIQEAVEALEDKDTELAGLINANTAKFADYSTTAQMNSAIETAINAIPAVDLTSYAKTADVDAALELKANAADVYTKTEADNAFMTEGEVDARINTLIAAADPEGGETITNIQNLVKYVDENAGEIAALVTTVDGHTTSIADINNALAAIVQPKASAEISVAKDGTLGVVEVNVNKLVQTEGDTLILNGGNAQ